MAAQRTVDIFELVRWVYRDQKAHYLCEWAGLEPIERLAGGGEVISLSPTGRASAILELGAQIDAGRPSWVSGHVHPAAEDLHARVRRLPARDQRLVIRFGDQGGPPDPQLGAWPPRPIPAWPKDEHDRSKGHRATTVPVYAPRSRRVAYRRVFVEISWAPSALFVVNARRLYSAWHDAMMRLSEEVPARFHHFEVRALPHDAEPWDAAEHGRWLDIAAAERAHLEALASGDR